jgi:hypothetical protein
MFKTLLAYSRICAESEDFLAKLVLKCYLDGHRLVIFMGSC